MGEDTVTIGQFHAKHRIRQKLDNGALYFNCVFPRHVRISGSFLVIRIVCSKCADGLPSAVQTVHPLSRNLTEAVPELIIGSIARVIPAFNLGTLPRFPYFGTWRS